ncbi:LytR/AlgR family response regulator transcription factor [Parablautia muri]|uniref:Stage 0 sporulation protein A homolog n=1 Tax=Parablautia muri TaxID=2320879 RepID=A0A9X5BDT6_9FIRM|nr:LytTR family DNA-binding domain-containing protein [Parablautia muri]NBJ91895.1 DNA-binding response regulator [Parablautia muri]
MIKVMVIDDEPEIRRLLHKMVEKQPDYHVVSECGDFSGAVVDFARYKPDVVFMDIDLKGESGLECAKVMTELNPRLKVIFATAHSEYMANAFEIYAFDYLVKPFNMERVIKTLNRIRSSMEAYQPADEKLADKVTRPEHHRDKLFIKGKEQACLLNVDEIILVERLEGYTNIVTLSEQYKTSISLSEVEEKLGQETFMRCHKSYIINISRVTRIEPYGRWTYVVKFKDTDATALMTAQKYEEMKKMFA